MSGVSEPGVHPGKEFGLPRKLGETWLDVQFRETDGMAIVENGRGTWEDQEECWGLRGWDFPRFLAPGR